jgi:hypothetical protein
MKLAVLVLVAACQAGGGDDYPTRNDGNGPIGMSPGGSAASDAGRDGGDDAGVPIGGRVCILSDLRRLTTCDEKVDASKLTVSIVGSPSRAVRPSRLGDFTLTAPLGAFTWQVTGDVLDRIVTSQMPLSSENVIPVMTTALYNDTLGASSAFVTQLQGSIVVRVRNGVAPVVDVTATSNPAANNLAFYDGVAPLDWDNDVAGTGAEGVVWFPGLPLANRPPTLVTVTLSPPGKTQVSTQVTIDDQAITFVTMDLR